MTNSARSFCGAEKEDTESVSNISEDTIDDNSTTSSTTREQRKQARRQARRQVARQGRGTGHSCFLLAMLAVQGVGILVLLLAADTAYYYATYNVSHLAKELFLWACLVWLPLSCLLCCLGSAMEIMNAWE